MNPISRARSYCRAIAPLTPSLVRYRPSVFAPLALILALTAAIGHYGSTDAMGSMKARAQAQSNYCTVDGGKAEITIEYSPVFEGAVIKITMKCKGGKSDGWTCVNTVDKKDCTNPLVRPTETAVQSTTAQPGTIVGAADTGSHDPPTPVVIDQGSSGPTAPERSTAEPAPSPTTQDDERAP